VVGILSVATVLATPLAGSLVDRFPRRYAIIAGGVLMAVAAAGFVGVRRLGWLLDVLRVVQGLSYALVVTAVGTLVADVVPRERLNHALGLSGASMLVMNAVAPAIAEPLATAAGWQAVFALAALAAATSALLASRIREPLWTRPAAVSGGLRALLAQPIARHYAVVVALSGATFGTVFTFEPAYAVALGRTRVGGFFVAYAAAGILVRVVLGGAVSRLGSYRVARAALVLYALVVLALAAAGPAAFELLGALFGVAHGLFYPALNAIAVVAVRPHERGRMIAVFSGAFACGVSAGSSGLGWVAAQAGYPIVFAIAACGTLTAVAVLIGSPVLRAAGQAMHAPR
jgi:MFS family permease